MNNEDSLCFISDSIVISEFSEKEGPMPRYVLGSLANHIPLDKFVLKLMSVDLQIDFNEKWTVWFQWTKYKIESISIYINLKDIYARGYSRFIAISYVTDQLRKISQNKDIFIDFLSNVADILIKSNIYLFKKDIERCLNDISIAIRVHELNNMALDNPLLKEQKHNHLKDKIGEIINELRLPNYNNIKELYNDLRLILNRIDDKSKHIIDNDNIDSFLYNNINNLHLLKQFSNVKELQYKSSLYDRHLRTIKEITSPIIFNKCIDKLESFLKKIRHEPLIIKHMKDERNQIFNVFPTEPLSIGGVPMLNMNINNNLFKKEEKGYKLTSSSSDNEYIGSFIYDNFDLSSICTILWPSLPYQSIRMDMDDSPKEKKINNDECSTISIDDNKKSDKVDNDIKIDDFYLLNEEKSFVRNGYTLLEMSRHLSFTRHIIFSLLKGRTIMIYAEERHRKAVEKTIENIRIFIPGNCLNKNQRIIPWLNRLNCSHYLKNSSSIGIEILSFCKLVGVDKSLSITQQVKRNVSLWDWESETFNAPCYENGLIIDMIINPKKKWPNDISYRAYIHYVLFNEFAIKAYIYYHMIWIGLKISLSTKKENKPNPNKKKRVKDIDQIYEYRNRIKGEFFKGLNIMENDAEIIDYLVEIIKDSQSDSTNKNRIILDYSKTKLFNRVSF